MLSKNGYLKLIDFGTSVVFNENRVPAEFLQNNIQIKSTFRIQYRSFINKASFVGTENVFPEIFKEEICGYAADLWV